MTDEPENPAVDDLFPDGDPMFCRLREIANETSDLEGSSFSGVFDAYLQPYRERYVAHEAHFRGVLAAAREKDAATGVPPTERQLLARKRIEAGIELLDQFLRKWPTFIMKQVLIKLATTETEPTAEMVDQVRETFAKTDVVDKSEIKHFLQLLMTEDPLGIMLRGHVLVENALDQCLVAALVNPQRLHDDLKMFYAEKVKLAFALGLISDSERQLLSGMGGVRNALVHYERNVKKAKPRYFLTADEEARLWRQFRDLGISGPWPDYEPAEFPSFLKLMLTGLLILLSTRSQHVKPGSLPAITHEIDQYFVTALTRFVCRFYPKVWDAIE